MIHGNKTGIGFVQNPQVAKTPHNRMSGIPLAEENFSLQTYMKIDDIRRQNSANPGFVRHQRVRATPVFLETIKGLLTYNGIAAQIDAKLRNRALVDLGCGDEQSIEVSRKIAEMFGAKLIVVDPHLPDCFLHVNTPEFTAVRSDAFTYVSGLPDGSANFMMCGVDNTIIESTLHWNGLAEEIARKTRKGGIVMGMVSDLEKYLPLKEMHISDHRYGEFVFEKR
jgi:hypothetical protein